MATPLKTLEEEYNRCESLLVSPGGIYGPRGGKSVKTFSGRSPRTEPTWKIEPLAMGQWWYVSVKQERGGGGGGFPGNSFIPRGETPGENNSGALPWPDPLRPTVLPAMGWRHLILLRFGVVFGLGKSSPEAATAPEGGILNYL